MLSRLKSEVRRRFRDAPGCHDWDHTTRVLRNARAIARGESGGNVIDMAVVEAAAVLHDVARPEELCSEGKRCHAELGVGMSLEVLSTCGCLDPEFAAKVSECVRRHRFRGKQAKPETIEQKIVYDADKLDQLGAVGVGRAIHFSGRIGSVLHNSQKAAMASEAYSKGDSAYREYLVKLRHIPGKMLTSTGRCLAAERAEYMHNFFSRLDAECQGKV